MKRKLYSIAFLFALIAAFTGCRSASKLYEHGQYEDAMDKAIRQLKKKPGDAQSLELLSKAYKWVIQQRMTNIGYIVNGHHELKWEHAASEYESMQRFYYKISESPVAMQRIQPYDYRKQIADLHLKAAEVRFNRGNDYLNRGNKEWAKRAYNEFQLASRMAPADQRYRSSMDEAFDAAVTNVIVTPAQVYEWRLQDEARSLEQNLIRDLNRINTFVRFYSPYEAERRQLRPDQFLEMEFANLNLGRLNTDRLQRDVVKDNVLIREVYIRPDSVIREYGRVSARMTTIRKTLNAEVLLRCRIRSYEGDWLLNETFRSNRFWSNEYATFSGDQRALTEEDKQLTARRDQDPPREEQLFRQLVDNLSNDLNNRLNHLYR